MQIRLLLLNRVGQATIIRVHIENEKKKKLSANPTSHLFDTSTKTSKDRAINQNKSTSRNSFPYFFPKAGSPITISFDFEMHRDAQVCGWPCRPSGTDRSISMIFQLIKINRNEATAAPQSSQR
jgi:hypothetical protein